MKAEKMQDAEYRMRGQNPAEARGYKLEEIVRSLRACSDEDRCNDCVFRTTPIGGGCTSKLRMAAVELIEAQAKRIGELEEQLRWIPVTERMPETVRCGVGEYSEAVEVVTAGRKVMIAVWDGVDWNCAVDYWEAWGDPITHWRNTVPMPKATEEAGQA